MVLVDIANLTSLIINEDKIKDVVKKTIEIEKGKQNLKFSIVFLGPKGIKKINKQYRGKNRATDVLSFNFQEKDDIIFNNLENENLVAAEIFICLKQIRKDLLRENKLLAKDKNFKIIFEKRVLNILIHGLLHCLGYDHQNEEQLKRMINRQKEILFHL